MDEKADTTELSATDAEAPAAAPADGAASAAGVGERRRVRAVRTAPREGWTMRVLSVVLFVVCCFLGYDLYYGHNGYVQHQKVQEQLEIAQHKALLLKERNQDLAYEIKDLQQGSVAVEELARSELGLIKPNERFYRVLADDHQIRSMPIP